VQIDRAIPDRGNDLRWKSVGINFQADSERSTRAHAGTHAAKFLSLNREVEVQRIPPKCLITECIEPERPPPFSNSTSRVADHRIVCGRRIITGRACDVLVGGSRPGFPCANTERSTLNHRDREDCQNQKCEDSRLCSFHPSSPDCSVVKSRRGQSP